MQKQKLARWCRGRTLCLIGYEMRPATSLTQFPIAYGVLLTLASALLCFALLRFALRSIEWRMDLR